MAEALATMVVGPLVSMVKEKASSYLLEQYKVMEGLEKQHKLLKRKLPAILDVITDAEEQAAAKREGAKAWLEEVRQVAYQANDVLDEFKYEALRRKAKKEGHYKVLGMEHNRTVFRNTMGNRLHMILQELDVLIAEMNAFRFEFRLGPPVPVNNLRENSSDMIHYKNIASESRAKEKKKVVKALLDEASNVNITIFPIVGMGGMGKTTLAQLVYNDLEIQKHFQLRLWVCVSHNFDVDSLVKSTVEEAKKNGCQVNENLKPEEQQKNGCQVNENLKPEEQQKNGCQVAENLKPEEQLQSAVRGKRYLLVLDDVWNRDEPDKWEKLKSYLQHGGSGSSVLITTRDQAVAELMMGTTEGIYKLGNLRGDFIAKIIKTRAFRSKEEKDWPRDKVNMVGDFVKRCAGSPLAATALGSVLSTMNTVDEWESVLKREKICDEKNGILPVLKLSYNCLPSNMRQCFAFCAMFPKDYEIDVEMLIQLWMANGFIPEQPGEEPPEISGKNIFIELASRSFFQDVKGIPFEFSDIKVSRATCKIHDLMHDVALDSMGKECAAISTEQSESGDFPHSSRHLFLSVREPETFLNASQENGYSVIQTLICEKELGEDLQNLSKYKSARALRLNLSGFKFRGKRASFLNPRCLHHVRYLDLSKSYIKSLPEDISILYHLQTLNLSYCYQLERLPKGMKYLSALRHLYTHGCLELKSMPADLRHLTSLQTLTCFVAGAGSDCSKLRELGRLDDLGGQLELRQLENVKVADAEAAKIRNKKKLASLTLRWSDGEMVAQSSEKEVLEGLKPHDELKVLRIYSYGGDTCPTWMNKLQCIVKLQLIYCEKLENFPAIWQLPALKVLCLRGLQKFEAWWDTSEVRGEKPIFPLLEKLSIWDCKKLPALPKASVIKTSFGGVEIECRSAFPVLREMELRDLEMFQRWEAGEGIPGEEQVIFPLLEIGGVETECHSTFPALRELALRGLMTLKRWEVALRGLTTLERREEGEGNPGEELKFPRLEELIIRSCPKLTSLPEAPKLSVFDVEGVSQQILSLHLAASRYTALSRLKLIVYNEETESVAEQNSSDELMHGKEKWDHRSPLTHMALQGYNLLFSHSSAPALWACYVQLVDLQIHDCDALDYWPEKVFQALVCLRTLRIWGCSKLTGRTQEGSEQSAPERSGLLPCLESLQITNCESLEELPNLPASLKTLDIGSCYNLKSIAFGQQEDTSSSIPGSSGGEARASTAVLELSSTNRRFLPCLEKLTIWFCDGVSEVANLPPSIKFLSIYGCSNLRSLSGQLDALQQLSIEHCNKLKSLESSLGSLPSLEDLFLLRCDGLRSLPNGPQAYSSLRALTIKNCSGIRLLPPRLQECLDDLEVKSLDARYEGWQYAVRRRLACLK